jgi:predicted nucleotidyltransferase
MAGLALLADDVGVNERTLRRAINEGSLHASRPTPRKLELGLAERQYIRRFWPLLSALRSALRTEPNVRFALLFGSAATGTATAASDLDILVRLRDPSLEHVIDLGARLERRLGRPVDLVRLEDAESDPAFLAHVVSQGRVLVDRDGVWPAFRPRTFAPRSRGDRRVRAALAGIDDLLAGASESPARRSATAR